MALARCPLVIQDELGNLVNGASVEVRRESDNGLQPIFSDRAGVSSLGNPFTAADGADAGFHAAGGAYKITATAGAFSRTWRYVAIGTAAESDLASITTAATAAVTAIADRQNDWIFKSYDEGDIIIPTVPAAADEITREPGNVLSDPEDAAAPYKYVYSGHSGAYAENNVFIFAASSLDGNVWTRIGKLITRSSEDPYLVKFNGTYYLYVEDKQPLPFTSIRLYTSTDFVSWTDRGDVLAPSGANSPPDSPALPDAWESVDVSSPIVWVENGVFFMLYEGRAGVAQEGAIGLATSFDGIAWTKQSGSPGPNPVVTPNIPTFFPTRTDVHWAKAVSPDDLIKIGNRYVMTFHGAVSLPDITDTAPGGLGFQAGILVSADLLTWKDALGHFVSSPHPKIGDSPADFFDIHSSLHPFRQGGDLKVVYSDGRNIRKALARPAPCQAYFSARSTPVGNTQALTVNAFTKLTFNSLELSTRGDFDLTNSRFLPARAGLYEVFLGASILTNISRHGALRIKVTGRTGVRQQTLDSFASAASALIIQRISGSCVLYLFSGEQVEFELFVDAGAPNSPADPVNATNKDVRITQLF